jgi:multiple sugar transport system permease protein
VEKESRLHQWLGRETFTAYAFLAIPLLLFIFTKFYPVLYNVVLSFTNYDLFSPMKFIGLVNYEYVFTNEVTLKAIRNTILFTIGIVPIGTSLSLTVATLLNQPIRGRVAFRTIYYLPVITSSVVTSLIWKFIYSQQKSGLLNQFLSLFGVAPQGWLTDPRLARFSLFVISWWGLGGSMVIFLAALQDIPVALYEAAKIDGARGWQSFLYITVPMLRQVILFVVVTGCIGVFRAFGMIFLLTQGGPSLTTNTLVWEVYMNAFGYLRLGRAGAVAVVLVSLILLITILNFRLLREREG